ncbi:hypothetical protein [Tumebacillus flagellatus]|nr:hypothetical protein [Tumebacillus flagellatus]
MKKRISAGLLLCAVLGCLIGGATFSKAATWSDPEPLGIVLIKK